jgi:uncharacterized protein YbjT (DUF2867 family)
MDRIWSDENSRSTAMKNALVAGATGYLGRYLVQELKKQGYWVRALARNTKKLDDLKNCIDEVFEGEVTKPETLSGLCKDIDVVISSVGITRQKDGLTYMDVDYQGNKNLLDLAIQNKVSKFIFISVLNAQKIGHLKGIEAKLLFEEDLIKSGLDYVIMRPTGFFSDMQEFLNMAKKDKVSVFGSGENKINPIHGADLAEVCVKAITESKEEINVGGPEVFTFNEIAEMALKVQNKPIKISRLPMCMIKIILPMMRIFTSSKTYGPVEFMMTVMTMDVVGEKYGSQKLIDFYEENK